MYCKLQAQRWSEGRLLGYANWYRARTWVKARHCNDCKWTEILDPTFLQGGASPRGPGLGWLRFGMFHNHAWAVGSYSSGPPAWELSKSKSTQPRSAGRCPTLYFSLVAYGSLENFQVVYLRKHKNLDIQWKPDKVAICPKMYIYHSILSWLAS